MNCGNRRDPKLICLKFLLQEAYRFHNHSLAARKSIAVLSHKIDAVWDVLGGTSEQKYEYLQGRLTALFLWDRSSDDFLFELEKPSLHKFEQYKHERELRLLRVTHAPGTAVAS